MKITVDENLSAHVAYGNNEIRIHKNVYDLVPQDLKGNFGAVLEYSYDLYKQSVAQVKARGEKPKALALKKQAFETVLQWLKERNLTPESVHRVTTSNPRIPKDNEVPRVVQKQSYFADVETTPEEIAKMFDTFDSETLADSAEEKTEEELTNVSVDLDDDLFEGEDLLDGLDDF